MARVTEEEVREIINTSTDLLPSGSIDAFITAANVFVTDVLSGTELGEASLKEIERWLAAHFTAIRDPRPGKRKVDDAEDDYRFKIGFKFYLTPYGQQAVMLDWTGTLESMQEDGASKQPIVETMR